MSELIDIMRHNGALLKTMGKGSSMQGPLGPLGPVVADENLI